MKPIIVEIADASARGNSHSSAVILKHGPKEALRDPTIHLFLYQLAYRMGLSFRAGAINREMSLFEASQTLASANPNCAIRGSQDRAAYRHRQTLPGGPRRDCKTAKPVQAIAGRHPQIAFSILEEGANKIPGETVGLVEHVSSALVNVP